MAEASYGYKKNITDKGFDEVLAVVTDALKTEGFGVLTQIDVKETLKKKLNVDFRKYLILGACNPPLAHNALQNELLLGLLLPCNVVVFEEDDGSVTVSLVNPSEMFKAVDNPGLADIQQVDTKLKNVLQAI